MSLPPGIIARVGGIYDTDNEELNGLGALSFSGRTDDRRMAWSATFDYQSRYNVKVLDQQLFDDTSPGFDPATDGRSMFDPDGFDPTTPSTVAVEHEDQIDTRDSTDLSFNGDLTFALAPDHQLRLDALRAQHRTRRDGRPACFTCVNDGTRHRQRRRRRLGRGMGTRRDRVASPAHRAAKLRRVGAL